MTMMQFAIARVYGQLVEKVSQTSTLSERDLRLMERLAPVVKQYEAAENPAATARSPH
jgi:hypothetical protein